MFIFVNRLVNRLLQIPDEKPVFSKKTSTVKAEKAKKSNSGKATPQPKDSPKKTHKDTPRKDTKSQKDTAEPISRKKSTSKQPKDEPKEGKRPYFESFGRSKVHDPRYMIQDISYDIVLTI